MAGVTHARRWLHKRSARLAEPMSPEQDRPITEAEYAAMLPAWMRKVADDLTETVLPDWAKDAGMRFEWEGPDEP